MQKTKTIHALLFICTAVLIAACQTAPRTTREIIGQSYGLINETAQVVKAAKDSRLISPERAEQYKHDLTVALDNLDAARLLDATLHRMREDAKASQQELPGDQVSQMLANIEFYLGQALVISSTVRTSAQGGDQ